MSSQRFNFKISGANGMNEHPGAASVEAMDTGDLLTPIGSASRPTVKSSIMNKQPLAKPIYSGKVSK
jgi:hypothetical protein